MDNSDAVYKPVFIGHGSPLNAISKNRYTEFLAAYAKTIPAPEAIVVISAHWQTTGTRITGSDQPDQIYDFYGFPEALYQLKYTPPGSAAIAGRISSVIQDISVDPDRGIDHAGWAVVKHLYPEQNFPLLELSLDINKSPADHFRLGQELGGLSRKGILFIGSGNLVHNLGQVSFDPETEPFAWAVAADRWLADSLQASQIDRLVDYEKHFPDYKRSIPTNEHYLPLLYILGMHDQSKPVITIYEEIQNGSISMRSIEVA